MKINKILLLAALLCPGLPAFSAPVQNRPGEEKKLEASARELDKHYSEGRQRVADMIKAEFGVDDALLMGLRYRKLKDSEIAVALALAQGLHGGIKDENVHKVVALRQGPPKVAWGKAAKELGLPLAPVLARIQKIAAAARKQEKKDIVKIKKKAEDGKDPKKVKPGSADTEAEQMKSLMRN